MAAANAGSINAVQLLIEHGANIDIKDNREDTALSLAKQAGHTDIVQLLQKAGAKEDSNKIFKRDRTFNYSAGY